MMKGFESMYSRLVQKTITLEEYPVDQETLTRILDKTTHLCICAHCDDVEIMAYHGINACFKNENSFFTAVIVTDGKGSDKSGIYSQLSDQEFINLRKSEQRKAAIIGEYNAVVFLDYSSSAVKKPHSADIQRDILDILNLSKPKIIYTHSPFDFHATHVGVTCQLMEVLKHWDKASTIENIYGCEVWGSLDWLSDNRKVALDVSNNINIQKALVEVFDTQMSRGKAFDEATLGRRKANATFQKSHEKDSYIGVNYALDLIDIIKNNLSIQDFVNIVTEEFRKDTLTRILKTTIKEV